MLSLHRVQFITAVLLLRVPASAAFLCRSSGTHNRALCSTATARVEADVHDLQAELDAADLGLCHGILHAAGVRELQDLRHLTEEHIADLGLDTFDRRSVKRVQDALRRGEASSADSHRYHDPGRRARLSPAAAGPPSRALCTLRDGAFDRKALSRFEVEEPQDFRMQTICAEHEVYRGVLFDVDQCEQLNRMSEHYAYHQIGTIGGGWSDQIYTLTAQHMACKDVPGMLPSTRIIVRQLLRQLYVLFPAIVPGSIVFENDGEPHLVKYNGRAKGTVAHTDNSEYKFITVNAVLSAEEDYTGGGTHITALGEVLRLGQGEMLIHLGDLEHAGADIHSGVRRLLIAFLACRWKDEALNRPILENARDYEG